MTLTAFTTLMVSLLPLYPYNYTNPVAFEEDGPTPSKLILCCCITRFTVHYSRSPPTTANTFGSLPASNSDGKARELLGTGIWFMGRQEEVRE
jgi:hypothetical protein